VPWLRSLNGCANDYSRDPSARATFGVFSPESKATIHVRELFN
jgi:MSHA biogenesis protein MshQ